MSELFLPTAVALRAGSEEGLHAAANWFLNSGIMTEAGGVARYYRSDIQQNARVSTEITGYSVSILLDLHRRLGRGDLLAGARRAGDFLCAAWREQIQAMPFEWAPDGALPEDHTYFFDCGIIARGLLRLWRATGEERYLRIATGCGDSMRRDFENGVDIDPILELPSKRAVARDERWSRSSDCYQLKSALAWLELADATGDPAWTAHYDRCLERSLRQQAGFLTREPGVRVMDRLHSYGYFLEALLPRCNEAEIRAALAEGIDRAAAHLRRVRDLFERSDANAQLLRVRLFADAFGAVKLNAAEAGEEAAWAARYQMLSEDARLDGGFRFGQREGTPAPYANPVSSAFCAQALAMWTTREADRAEWSWRDLV